MQNIYIIAFIIILLIIYSCKKSDVQIANKPIVIKPIVIKRTIPLQPIKKADEKLLYLDEYNIMSDELKDVDGIYDAPMYMPVDDINPDIFLLNQMNQIFNDTVAYVDPEISINELSSV